MAGCLRYHVISKAANEDPDSSSAPASLSSSHDGGRHRRGSPRAWPLLSVPSSHRAPQAGAASLPCRSPGRAGTWGGLLWQPQCSRHVRIPSPRSGKPGAPAPSSSLLRSPSRCHLQVDAPRGVPGFPLLGSAKHRKESTRSLPSRYFGLLSLFKFRLFLNR